jgi:predicted exporter
MLREYRVALGLWIAGMALCATLVARTGLSTDMSAFLPRSPSAAQQVLVDQVRAGVVSRLILLGLEGAPAETLAALSRTLAARLRGDPAFLAVNNGDEGALAGERELLWRDRYLLSPGVAEARFSTAGLRAALENDLRLLRSDMAVLVKRTLPNDPTGEILILIDQLAGPTRPHTRAGVWLSRDERRAVLLLQTRAAGFDIDAQQHTLAIVDGAFAAATGEVPGAAQARLVESGPAVFAVRTRATMESDATRFSLLATVVVAGLLLFAYRSLPVLLCGLLPVASGALAGIAAVALGFGFVHGITLGFGVTLIGESVDYAIYLFTQTPPGGSPAGTLSRIWQTLRLGMLTSIAGFSVMLFSSFAGFAQLGLFSISGLLVALGVTRWILPALLPRDFAAPSAGLFALPLLIVVRQARRLRLAVLLLALAGGALLVFHHGGFWQEDLSSLSPIPAADQKLDQELRRDIGAPDVRYLVVLTESSEQRALQVSELISSMLGGLTAHGALVGFDAPSQFLPSDAAQRARQAALPDPDTLEARLREALTDLPFRPEIFAPFLGDVTVARSAPLMTRAALPAALTLKLDSLLFERRGEWIAVLSLRGVSDPERVAAGVASLARPGVTFVDLKQESDRLLRTYQREAIMLAAIGGLVVLLLLSASLRSPGRVLAVVAPLAASVIVTAALLTLDGRKLSIFNLVGLLLIVSVGSNYCLFFERQSREQEHRDRAIASLVLANLCTDFGFGILSFSGIPVLHDIGFTVALGTLLSLFFSAILSTGGVAARAETGWRSHF